MFQFWAPSTRDKNRFLAFVNSRVLSVFFCGLYRQGLLGQPGFFWSISWLRALFKGQGTHPFIIIVISSVGSPNICRFPLALDLLLTLYH